MRALIVMVYLACAGCEGESILQCGYACKNSGSQMVSYSATGGCRCASADAGSGE